MSEDNNDINKEAGKPSEEPAAKPSAGETPEAEPKAAETAAAAAPTVDPEKEAKLKAAAEARAARAAAKAAAEAEAAAEPEEPKPPSRNQPRLDQAVALLREQLGEDAVSEAYINEMNGDAPTLIIQAERIREAAELFKQHESLRCNYLRNVSGVDYETEMEVVYHLIALDSKHDYVLKVKTSRETPSVPSVTPVWATADWNEREIFDLLGIDFPGHPNLTRIMMPDDWQGHPLRKDYEPLDSEV